MHLIIYTSRFTGNKEKANEVLKDICQASQRNNPKRDVTGLLFYHNSRFLQVLEGEKQVLEQLLELLDEDERHCDVQRLIDSPITTRDFEQWNMDTLNLSEDDSIGFDELQNITEVYKSMLQPETKVLSDFYRQIIESKAMH